MTAASGKILFVELGPDHVDRLPSLLQVADLHRLVGVHLDNLLSSFTIFNQLCSCIDDRVHDPFTAHTRFSHAPCGGSRARNTFASLWSVLSCVTNTIRISLAVLAAARRTPPVAMCVQCLVETHKMQCSRKKRWQ